MAVKILTGDCREQMKSIADASVQCCVTSPPYWCLRDYGVDGQLGLEATPEEYVDHMVEVFRDVRRCLKADGTLWLNLGDSYAGASGVSGEAREGSARADGKLRDDGLSRRNRNGVGRVRGLKPKDLVGIPWMVAFALRADGWFLRLDIIWSKLNPMPESVTDRPTKSHEYMFLLAKSDRYYYDAAAIAEATEITERSPQTRGEGYGAAIGANGRTADRDGGFGAPNGTRNKRSVWTLAMEPCSDAHFAVFPSALIVPCILAGSRIGDTVLDPFGGSGTTGRVATELGRHAILCELNPEYVKIIESRTAQLGLFAK